MSHLKQLARRISDSATSGTIRTAGKIEFLKDQGPLRRDIRAPGFVWDQESLENLTKILWSAQRAHSYAITAYKLFSKMPSSSFSPDGLLGGRGYIQSIKDMRSAIAQSAEALSSFTDTIQDEISADHWKATLDENADSLSPIVQDIEEVREHPERYVESEFNSEVSNDFEGDGSTSESEEFDYSDEPIQNPKADDLNPDFESGVEEDDEEETSYRTSSGKVNSVDSLPTDKKDQGYSLTAPELIMETTTPAHGDFADALAKLMASQVSRYATSSIPVDTLPGPRVDHIGPGGGNELGYFGDEYGSSDDLAGLDMSSGVNESKHLYEDDIVDGVSAYSDPTSGDDTILNLGSYSWLPGADNDKIMDTYKRGLTEADIEWMKSNNSPDSSHEKSYSIDGDGDDFWMEDFH